MPRRSYVLGVVYAPGLDAEMIIDSCATPDAHGVRAQLGLAAQMIILICHAASIPSLLCASRR